jgi:predicted lipoprotein
MANGSTESKQAPLHIYAESPLAVLHSPSHSSPLRSHGSRRWLPFFLFALPVLGLLIWKPPFVIRPLQSNNTGGANQSTTTGPAAFVEPIWDSKIVPTFLEKAVEAKELLTAIQGNSDQAGEKFGRREATNPYNYLIKGTGKVTAVNMESRAGTLTIELPGDLAWKNVNIQIGPVVLGTAVRDATGVVSFNQFTNQIDYASVSKEMNARAIHDALAGKDPATFNGKQIRFVGAFTYDPHFAGVVRITPIKLEVQN